MDVSHLYVGQQILIGSKKGKEYGYGHLAGESGVIQRILTLRESSGEILPSPYCHVSIHSEAYGVRHWFIQIDDCIPLEPTNKNHTHLLSEDF